LRNRQVAGGHEDHQAIARILEHAHLARSGDMVDTRIGTGVGEKNQAGIEAQGNAVSHGVREKRKERILQEPKVVSWSGCYGFVICATSFYTFSRLFH
jgi:hypothetical protein